MTPHLHFDFTVNKDNNTIHVEREFAGDLETVWDCWTRPELLDQWWAPKPYRTRTKSMDFREGGAWFYAMISPENVTHWCRADYQSIDLHKSFSGLDAFCDEMGQINTEFPRAQWNNRFNPGAGGTRVNITIQYKTLADVEKIISMGFKEGFTMALENLDRYLEERFRLWRGAKTGNTARVCTYLNFDGNTEEAFQFYRSVFRTEFGGKGIQRFGDIPAETDHPPVADAIKKMILHIELPITGNHVLMATDAPKEMGFTLTQGNNMHISIEPESREEAKRIFDELSAGGVIEMPLKDMFFGSYFGSFTDRFGINWFVNYQTKP
jgi:PhnB protein